MVERITNNMERSFLAGVHALAPLGHKDSGGMTWGENGKTVFGKQRSGTKGLLWGGDPSGHTSHLGFVPANT